MRSQRLVQPLVNDTGLDAHGEVCGANLQHEVHAAEVGDQPACLRDGVAFEAGARAARGHGDAAANGQLDDCGDFLGGRRPRDGVRQRGR